jgi:hypothetical protein
MVPLVSSFNVQPLAFRTTSRTSTTNVQRNMLPPDFLNDPAVLDHLTSQLVAVSSQYDAMTSTAGVVAHASMSVSSSQFLADATVEVADKASWWQSYLAVFKGALNLVHSTIDQPLRSVGIDQTWGISIAIFTAGKYRRLNTYVLLFVCMYWYCTESPRLYSALQTAHGATFCSCFCS